MTISTAEKRANFRKLHESGCFVLPNPWDVGSARYLAHLGFKALASTSAGYAWSTGRPDNKVTADDVIEHLALLSRHGPCEIHRRSFDPVRVFFEKDLFSEN